VIEMKKEYEIKVFLEKRIMSVPKEDRTGFENGLKWVLGKHFSELYPFNPK